MAPETKEHVTRACLACKEKKIRCRPSEEDGAVDCQRCHRTGKECVFPEVHARPRRKRFLNRRLEMLEKNFDSIASLLAAHREHSSAQQGEKISPLSPSASADMTPRSGDHSLHDGPLDIFDTGLISIGYADGLVQNFIHMAPYFPYVVLPKDITVVDLRHEFPMLLHAILVTASWQNKSLQLALEAEYLKTLITRLIIDGQKSLDILQSMLIYVGWFHFHASLEKQQISRLTSLLVALAADLGLPRRPKKSERQQMAIESHPVTGQGVVSSGPDFWNRESRRAFIGCYVFSASYYIFMRKANPMRYNAYIEECATSLAIENRVPSDTYLVYFVRAIRFAEDIYETFGYNDLDPNQYMSEEKSIICVNAFTAKLNEWKESLPSTLSWKLEAWCLILQAYCREIGLYGTSQGPDISVARTTLLYDCVAYAKTFLDTILTIPLEELQAWTSLGWAWVTYAIILISKASLSVESPAWNADSARSIIRLEVYLDSLALRIKELNALISPSKGSIDWYHYLGMKLETTKSKYLMALSSRASDSSLASNETTMAMHEPSLVQAEDPSLNAYQMLSSFEPGPLGAGTFWTQPEMDPWPFGAF